MPSIRAYFPFFLLLCASIAGCNRYAFSVNNNEVYRPPPLYSGFEVADAALDSCIRQTIADKHIVKAEQLTALRCTHGGIKDLRGLEQFTRLVKVDLSGNDITNSVPLMKLQRLEYVKLSENPQLDCASARPLLTRLGDGLLLPAHCASL